jgi:hypothetical protein
LNDLGEDCVSELIKWTLILTNEIMLQIFVGTKNSFIASYHNFFTLENNNNLNEDEKK